MTFDTLMKISIEGPKLKLDMIINLWKTQICKRVVFNWSINVFLGE